MVPRWFAVPFLLAVGAILLRVAYRGYLTGDLPAGASYWRNFRVDRQEKPFLFRIFLALYFCAGIALCVWGLLAMVGMAPSLRWHE